MMGTNLRTRALAAVVALGLLRAVCCAAADVPRMKDPMRKVSVAIHADDAHEECFHLGAGDSVDYRYKAVAPVTFNIHYHTEREVVTPVEREDATSDAGSYVATEAQGYCMMWINARDESTQLEYDFRINRRAE